MNSRVYKKEAWEKTFHNISESRKYQKFLDENTRKVLVEKTKKVTSYNITAIRYSMDSVLNSDFVIELRRTHLFNE
jgi:hypothetical protein